VKTYIEISDPVPLALIHRDLALHMEAAYHDNEVWYERWARHFRRAALLLGLEVLMLVIDLGTSA
jgi:hypothetical protein